MSEELTPSKSFSLVINYSEDQKEKIKDLNTYIDKSIEKLGEYIDNIENNGFYSVEEFGTFLESELKILEANEKGLKHYIDLKYFIDIEVWSELKNMYMFLISHFRTQKESSLTWKDYFSRQFEKYDKYPLIFSKMKNLLKEMDIKIKQQGFDI